jgi:hypothetical protein
METMTVVPLDTDGFVRLYCGNITATLTEEQAERMVTEYARQGGSVEWQGE